ncbi:hypothetical protein ACFFGR_18685 [Arthrobacter liuii]|uniref:hypothetical protein n=1 Tax=Arthrobacter liuii TaxID=1476996 RepID=UPI00166D78BD|nr:hypothetical protein [Arthrobacter liuii]
MTHLETFAVTAAVPGQVTFGRDGAMFESLLSFVAQLSLVLWSVVTLTVVIRFIGIRFYRRTARRALARIAAAGAPVPGIVGSGTAAPVATAAAAAAAAAPAAAAVAVTAPAAAAIAVPAIAVVPAIAAGIDLLQPANVPLTDAVTNMLATNSVDG